VLDGFLMDEHVPFVELHDNVKPIDIYAGVVKMT